MNDDLEWSLIAIGITAIAHKLFTDANVEKDAKVTLNKQNQLINDVINSHNKELARLFKQLKQWSTP